jgi:CSLREA domain-containing protein
MIKKLHQGPNSVLKALIALFLALWIVSASNATSISASPLPDTISPPDVIRQDMYNIAYLYAHHLWSASPRNLLFFYPSYPKRDRYLSRFEVNEPYRLLELDGNLKYFDNIQGRTLSRDLMDRHPVHTPIDDAANPSGWIVADEYLFTLDSSLKTDLNTGSVTPALIQEFQNKANITLTMSMNVPWYSLDNMWVILDGSTRYHIRPRLDSAGNLLIYVYRGHLNEGVPYAWGLSHNVAATSLDMASDPNIVNVLIPQGFGNQSFDQRIGWGHFAGNVHTDGDLENPDVDDPGNTYAAGVDCIGLINNVWRMGGRFSMLDTRDYYAQPIKFKDLKQGDILMDAENHVMMFDKFENYDPASGEEPGAEPGHETFFWVYEASKADGKVVLSLYKLGSVPTEIPRDDPAAWFKGQYKSTDRVNIYGLGTYIPRTYINLAPVDVVFVIDRSPSMSSRMNQIKNSAAMFINQMRPGDKIGVVVFDQRADTIFPLEEIAAGDPNDLNGARARAIQAINSVTIVQGTLIGEALERGKATMQISNPPTPRNRVMILISDGDDGWTDYGGRPYSSTIADSIRRAGITVHTLGIGSSLKEAWMKKIADDLGGVYQKLESPTLSSLDTMLFGFNTVYEKTHSSNTVVKSTSNAIAEGATLDDSILVDSAMGSMTISFFKSDSSINLTLIQPDETPLDINGPGVTFTSGEFYDTYTILAPQTGTWPVSISSDNGGNYSLSVSTMDAMRLLVDPDKDEYIPNEPIKLTASINDSMSGSLTAGPNYVRGADIDVTAKDPDGNSTSFEMLDDGLNGDEEESDGIYTYAFNGTSKAGVYYFDIQVSGENNRDAQLFAREASLSVPVIVPPTVTSIRRLTPTPTNYYDLKYTVTFSEPVTGVDASDFVLTTEGVSGAAIRAVSDSSYASSTYIVDVNTGSGNGTIRLDIVDDDTIEDSDDYKLGVTGIGNGNFAGESYTIEKSTRSTVVTKIEDTDDGMCDADCSLRESIAVAIPGETVSFDTALSGGTIHLASPLSLSRDITIDGSTLAVPITISGDTNDDGMGDVGVLGVNAGVKAVLDSLTISKSIGSGISNQGVLSVTNSTFSSNSGSGIYFSGYSNGTLTVANSTFTGNSSSNGAGVYISGGTVVIRNSTFSGNSATAYGGGIFNSGGGTLTLANSTFVGNSAANGGGIYNANTVTITNSTFSGNSASAANSAAGVYSGSSYSLLRMANSIIANSTGSDCLHTGSYSPNPTNLIEDGSCPRFNGERSGDPLLSPLADNGGPTQTMALLPGSPAINAGNDASCAAAPVNNLDQRGITRPQDAHCDLGAFEVVDENPPTVSAITIANDVNSQPSLLDFTVTFSEPVTGVDVSDFTLTTSDISGAAVSGVTGSGTTYTVSVEKGTGEGMIRLDVLDDDTIVDLAAPSAHPLAGGFTGGQTYTVRKVVNKLADTNDGLCDADCSLREAIAAAAPGDTITFDAALSGGTIRLDSALSTLTLYRNISINASALAVPITISGDTNDDGTGDVRVFYVDWDVTAALNHLTISKGYDPDQGGGIYSGGPLTITDITFSGNSAESGGGIYSYDLLTIVNSTFSGNSATDGDGGGILSWGTVTISGSSFSNNSAVSGYGGGVYVGPELTITDSTFSDNHANSGGAVIVDYDEATITNTTFSGNSASTRGGGVFVDGGELTVTDSVLLNNSAPYGGGFYTYGTLNLNNSTLAGNSAGDGYGGGIYNDSWLEVTNSTLLNNSAQNGGGIYNDSSLEVTNSTFSSNSATTAGGGIYNYSYLEMTNSTLSGNSAASGGGLYNDDASLYYANTIIANSTGGDCFSTTYSWIGLNTKNLVEDGSCSAPLNGDPNLGELADNDGPTQTMALLSGSPALDMGDDAICAAEPVNNLDQRGMVRPQGLHCDIGAFEAPPDENMPTVLSSAVTTAGLYSVNFRVTFSEYVTGVDASDFALQTAGVPLATIARVSGSGTTYTVTVSTGIGRGTIRLDVLDDDTITDGTNPLGGAGVGNGSYSAGEVHRVLYNISRISVSSEGVEGDLESDMTRPSISADGRYVAFYSNATNLVEGDTNGVSDVFVRDTWANTTTRISVAPNGTDGNASSYDPIISADGRYVAFVSSADNLVSGDTNRIRDVFVHDMQTGTTTLVSVATDGTQANYSSYEPSISANGRYIAFHSSANNLISGGTSYYGHIFLRDTQTNTTTQLSVATDGTQGDGYSLNPSISADGRYVAFYSWARNLVSGDTNSTSDVFLRDTQTNTTTRITLAADGSQSNSYSFGSAISADGRYIAFISSADNLVPGDTNGINDVFRRDRQTNTTTRISVAPDGTDTNNSSDGPVLSADGRYVVFSSYADNLVEGDTNGTADIFVNDTLAHILTRVSVAPDGGQANGWSWESSLSADGRYLAFTSEADNLVPGDTNEMLDVFVLTNVTNLPPVFAIDSVRASISPTSAESVDFVVTFSEPVIGVDVSDFALTTTGVPGAVVSAVSGSGASYTVTVDTGSDSGTIRLDVLDDDSIVNAAGDPLGGTGTGNGNFILGEMYDVHRSAASTLVTKLADTNDGSCDADCSLREAIAVAGPGATVVFDPALSGGTISLASQLNLSRDITIDGSALAVPVTVSGDTDDDGTGNVRVFKVNIGVTVTLNDLTISRSRGIGLGVGGGIYNLGTLTIANSTVSDHSASYGGAVYNEAELIVTNSTFSGNFVDAEVDGYGAGIYNVGSLIITGSTFSNNSADYGGGIFNEGELIVTNSTFSGNSVNKQGAGIFTYSDLTVTNSTFSGNSASSGGGLYNDGATLHYANTIIANSLGGDCANYGTIGTNVANLVEDGSCSAALSGDPNLGALADNGGPTQTMALLAGSPAVDGGDNAVCAAAPVNNLDQRGIVRPQGPRCDIGAFELGDANPPTALSSRVTNFYPAGVDFTVIFSENVTGVDASDFSLTTTIPGAAISGVTGSGTTYTVSVNIGSGEGTVRLDVLDDGIIVDMASNPLDGGFTGGETYTTNNASPAVVSSIIADAGPYSVNFTVTFSEYVTGVDASDFALTTTGAPLAEIVSVSGLGTSYTVTVSTGVGQGTVRLDVLDDDSITDGTNPLGGTGTGNGNYNAGETRTVSYSLSRVSISTEGIEANQNSYVILSAISADGRYITYCSPATNLVDGDTNEAWDIFLRDTLTNITTRISTATDGTEGNNSVDQSAISADGRYVVFGSDADNLVSGDTNGETDIFVHDVLTHTTTRVSVATDGTAANDSSYVAFISADGRYVAFHSVASNLVAGDTNGVNDIFVRDTLTNTTTRVSVATGGTQGNGRSNSPSISADGRYVAFASEASNLVGGDTNGLEDIFVRDTLTGTTTRVSVATDGTGGNGGAMTTDISADGRYVLFMSYASNLVSGDTNGHRDAFVRDTLTNTTTRVSVAMDGVQGNESTHDPTISADGRYIAFLSEADNLVAGDTNGMADIFVRDTLINTTTRISIAEDGTQGNDWSYGSTISADGQFIAFASGANNLVSGDANGSVDVFVFASAAPPPPSIVSSIRVSTNPTSAASVDFTMTFSEDVTGVDASDFALTTTGVSGAAISEVSGSDATYTVSVNTGVGSGTIRLDVLDDDTIVNSASIPLGGIGLENGNFTAGEEYEVVHSPNDVTMTVLDTDGHPKEGLHVYVFNGTTYMGYQDVTDENGRAVFILPAGSYRFRTDLNGTQFWSGAENHCTVPDCGSAGIVVSETMTVTVRNTDGTPKVGLNVYAFNGATYAGYSKTTNADGQAIFTLPLSSYRFRADYNGTQFWSGAENHCDIPGCVGASVTVSEPMTVTVLGTDGAPKAGLNVYVFNGSTYTSYSKITNADGQAIFTLPLGSYRFRADFNGTQFWSGAENHCSIPGCTSAAVTVTNSVVVTVQDTDGAPKAGLSVYAFNGATYAGYTGTTDESGQVTLTLPLGSYRFRADLNGTQFWSNAENHCDIPGCLSADVTVTMPVTVTVLDTDGAPKAGLNVYAFNGSAYTSYSKITNVDGQATLTLPLGRYRFRADYNGTQFWSDTANHCEIPGCISAAVTVTNEVSVTVQDTDGLPQSGLRVYAFNGSTYTGHSGTTDESGQVSLTLPLGSYRFRADLNGTQFWSDTENHCDVPGCVSAGVTVSTPVTVTVLGTDGALGPGLSVYAFNGSTYTSYSKTTNADGQAIFTLPLGSYRFRADLNGTQFWSGTENHCDIPGCLSAGVTVSAPVTVTVLDTDGAPQAGLSVYAFNDTTYTSYSKTTNADGRAVFTLPLGSYRFRADLNGTQFWSGTENHCDIPGCESAQVTVTIPVTVTAQDGNGTPTSGLNVYAFNGSTYTGYSKVSDDNGQVVFTLPPGNYRFRADQNGTQYWSNSANHCTLPGCLIIPVTVGPP